MPPGPGPAPGPFDGPTPPQQPLPMPPGPPGPFDNRLETCAIGSPTWVPCASLISGATITVGSTASFGISLGTITVGGVSWSLSDVRGNTPWDAGCLSKSP